MKQKILFISDVHFCDYRNSAAYEERRKRRLADLICAGDIALVVNIGDTVSRDGVLREELKPYRRELFADYVEWRASLGVPFVECGLGREKAFFEEIYGQPMDYVYTGLPGVLVVVSDPAGGADGRFTEAQVRWLEETLDAADGRTVVVGTHVPYPASCSRPIGPGIYLDVPEGLQRRLENFPSRVFWAGGHFHWELEAPVVHGSLTAFMGGRFRFESDPPDELPYLRTLDLNTLALETLVDVA